MSEAGTYNAMLAAAEAGDDKAQCELAMMYEHGIGCPKDYATAARWYGTAAQSGNGFAAYKLANMFENGLLGPPDFKTSMAWLKQAADAGLGEAQLKLGIMLDAGRGGEENPKDGAVWLRMAAEQGIADAQWRLGVMYENGRGVKQDNGMAAKLFAAASAQGNTNAHYSLGVLHVTGDGVMVNPGEALRLFTMAAEAGHMQARKRLERAKLTGKPEAEPEEEDNKKKKKQSDEPKRPETPVDFVISSIVQSVGLTIFLAVLVLTPLGEWLAFFFKVVGWPLALIGGVVAIISLLGMGAFFKKKKVAQEDQWFKIIGGILIFVVICLIMGLIGFSNYKFSSPDDQPAGAGGGEPPARLEQLKEKAKKAGTK